MDLYSIRQELNAGKSIYDLQLRVVYYVRVSTTTTEQISSFKTQIKYFEDFLSNQKNWTFIGGYADQGISGTNSEKRDKFKEMIEDAKNNKFDLIVTKEVSRFARNTLDSLYYTRELLKFGVGVLFQNDNINTLTSDSELRLTIMSSMAQDESRKISERVKWGRKRQRENGQIVLGRCWGYEQKDGKLYIKEKEAEMIRLIFDLYCQNYGYRKIADILNEKGYKNNNGNPFSYSTISGIIENERYMGYYKGNTVTTVDFLTKEKKYIDKDEWVLYKAHDIVPPIVTEEVWHKANNLLKIKADKMLADDKTSYQNKYKYSGKIYCKNHETTYWHNVYKYPSGNKTLWVCKEYQKKGKSFCDNPKIYENELDAIFYIIFKYISANKNDFISKYINMYEKVVSQQDYTKDIKDLLSQIEKIKQRKQKLLDLSLDESISNEEFKKRNDEMNMQIQELDKQIAKYETMNNTKYNSLDKIKEIKNMVNNYFEINKDVIVTDSLIQNMVDKIEVENGEIPNLIKLNIKLKIGIDIPVRYRKDLCLSLITHMINNKLECKFERRINNINTDITYEIGDILLVS